MYYNGDHRIATGAIVLEKGDRMITQFRVNRAQL